MSKTNDILLHKYDVYSYLLVTNTHFLYHVFSTERLSNFQKLLIESKLVFLFLKRKMFLKISVLAKINPREIL